MTVRTITRRLTEAGIDPADARREARLLVSRFTGTPVAHLLAAPDEDFDETAVCGETGLTLAEAVEQRRTRCPLQYILGEWEFYGLRFAVNEHTLIPRPETERIAEAAIRLCPENGRVLDLCTGSGCIAAAILAHVPTARGVAVDLYPETLRMAEKNLTALGLSDRCTFVAGDAGTDLFDPSITFDVIVSNPPYVTAEEMHTLAPELSYEPPHALTDGGDGLSLLESIIEIYQNHLGPAGVLILEHGWQQADAVRSIAVRSSLTPTPIPDYAGRTRGVILQK